MSGARGACSASGGAAAALSPPHQPHALRLIHTTPCLTPGAGCHQDSAQHQGGGGSALGAAHGCSL